MIASILLFFHGCTNACHRRQATVLRYKKWEGEIYLDVACTAAIKACPYSIAPPSLKVNLKFAAPVQLPPGSALTLPCLHRNNDMGR